MEGLAYDAMLWSTSLVAVKYDAMLWGSFRARWCGGILWNGPCVLHFTRTHKLYNILI